MATVLGYWDVRGVCEPIRYLLHYVGAEFEDKRYTFGTSDFETDKVDLELPLPNLPYLVDEDVKLTQSNVILRYIARKHGMYLPEGGDAESMRLDMVEGHLRDIVQVFMFILTNADFETSRSNYSPRIDSKLSYLADFIGTNDWLLGDEISHVDFQLFELLDVLRLMAPDVFENHEVFQKFHERFSELPSIQEYRNNSQKWPIYGPFVNWGGSGPAPDDI